MDALTHIRINPLTHKLIYTLTHFLIDVKGVYDREIEKGQKEKGFCIGGCRLLLGV